MKGPHSCINFKKDRTVKASQMTKVQYANRVKDDSIDMGNFAPVNIKGETRIIPRTYVSPPTLYRWEPGFTRDRRDSQTAGSGYGWFAIL